MHFAVPILLLISLAYSNPATFEGAWTLQVSGLTSTSALEDSAADREYILNITPSNTPTLLTGKIQTTNSDQQWKITIDFGGEKGEVRLVTGGSTSEDDEAFGGDNEGAESLFEIEFCNRTNGLTIANGPFKGAKSHGLPEGSFQLVVVSPTVLAFTIIAKDGSVITVTGKKELKEDGGFWSRMPSPLMMFGILLLTQWFKPRIPDPAARQPNAQGRSTRPVQPEGGNARVQDVTDEAVD